MNYSLILIFGLLLAVTGCGANAPIGTSASPLTKGASGSPQMPAVDVAVAQLGDLRLETEYTGTTLPIQEVLLRAQVEGQVTDLTIDVGDRVQAGQVIARIDDSVIATTITSAEAEVAARRSEVAQATLRVSDGRARLEEARLRAEQAQADAERLQKLFREGAIPEQQAEQARNEAQRAQQALQSAREQLRTQQAAIDAALERVLAQEALVVQAQERQNFTVLTAPISGSVLERLTESGNLIQPGGAIVRLGDLRRLKVVVQISELDLAKVKVGQTVEVRLDAFPQKIISGQVSRVSPAADPISRLIPIEVTIANPTGQVGSGLLARLRFQQPTAQRVIIPREALPRDRSGDRPGAGGNRGATPGSSPATKGSPLAAARSPAGDRAAGSPSAGNRPRGDRPRGNPSGGSQPRTAQIFVIQQTGDKAQVVARSVTLGEQLDGKVEILAGLKPGERFVTRSSRPLQDGEAVRLSVLNPPN